MTPEAVGTQNTGVYRFRIGAVTAVAVSDGQARFPAYPAYAANASEAEVDAALRSLGLDDGRYLLNTTALLLLSGDRVVLVDAGAGATLGPGFGRVPAALEGIGVPADRIDAVHLTHAHCDHIGGLVDAAGDPVFPSARLSTTRTEWDHWTDPDLDLSNLPIDETFRDILTSAVRSALPPYRGRLALFDDESTLAPGVTAVRTGGHTPGHSVVHVDSAGERLLVVGDLFHSPAFDLAHPHWCTAFDDRPDLVPDLRRRVFGEAADRGDLVFAYHAPFPGVGRLFRDGEQFRFAPAPWLLE